MDDQWARDQMIEHYCEVMHDAYEKAAVGNGWETQAASRKPWTDMPEANKATMRAAVAALLAALPVASRSDIPEQPTQANLPTAEENERVARLMAMVTQFGYASTLALLESETRLLEETRRANSLVSSPSEQSAAPKETATPAREAILRETIIREVIDWIEQGSSADGYQFDVADQAREHFGVSS